MNKMASTWIKNIKTFLLRVVLITKDYLNIHDAYIIYWYMQYIYTWWLVPTNMAVLCNIL